MIGHLSLVVANLLMDLSRSLLASTELDECASDEFYKQRKTWWREAWRHCEAATRIIVPCLFRGFATTKMINWTKTPTFECNN